MSYWQTSRENLCQCYLFSITVFLNILYFYICSFSLTFLNALKKDVYLLLFLIIGVY